MSQRLKVLAAAGAVSLCLTAPAFAGSVTQPGETVGIAAGAPLPPGFYFVNTADWGCRNTSPNNTCVGVDIPVIAWSTPWTILNGRLQFLLATPAVAVGVNGTSDQGGSFQQGMYNP
jgi:hypothetical protein